MDTPIENHSTEGDPDEAILSENGIEVTHLTPPADLNTCEALSQIEYAIARASPRQAHPANVASRSSR